MRSACRVLQSVDCCRPETPRSRSRSRRPAGTDPGLIPAFWSAVDTCNRPPGETRVPGKSSPDVVRVTPRRPIRVCLVAPSLDILGGQAVQAVRLLRGFGHVPSVAVGFVPINPRIPGLLGLLQRVRYVRTAVLNYHSGEAEDHLERWRRSAIPVVRLADALVVPSGYLVDVFARFGLRARVVANIVDLDQFQFRARRPLRPVFLSNRNFEAHYNVACVLRAFALIQNRYRDARLIVAGDGSQRRQLQRLADELQLVNVAFVGRVSPDHMPSLYAAADVYLNAPDIDNMPGSILEAFASGLPVVTTDAGGIPYIVRHGETGLLVPRGNHEGIAAAAIRLLQDASLSERLVGSAREECRRRYTPEPVLREWVRVYRALVAYGMAGKAEFTAQPARQLADASEMVENQARPLRSGRSSGAGALPS